MSIGKGGTLCGPTAFKYLLKSIPSIAHTLPTSLKPFRQVRREHKEALLDLVAELDAECREARRDAQRSALQLEASQVGIYTPLISQ